MIVLVAMPSPTATAVPLVIVGAWLTQPTSIVRVFDATSNRVPSLTLKATLA